MSTGSKPGEEERGLTLREKTILVWMFLSCPFTEHPKLLKEYFPDFSVKTLMNIFAEIISDPLQSKRILDESGGDILTYKPIPWSLYEMLTLAVGFRDVGQRNDYASILKDNNDDFHPNRTVPALMTSMGRMRAQSRDPLPGLQDKFRELVEDVNREIGDNEDLIDLRPNTFSSNPISSLPNACVSMLIVLQSLKLKNDPYLALLYGSNVVLYMKKPRITLGRESPKKKPDIDLTDFSLQSISRNHCDISLRSDYHFYIEPNCGVVLVNGKIVRKGGIVQLKDFDIIDIGGAPFFFYENSRIINTIRDKI